MILTTQHHKKGMWHDERVTYSDEHGNEAVVDLPHGDEEYNEWSDADIRVTVRRWNCSAEDLARSAEFFAEIARQAAIIDEAVAEEASVIKERAAQEEREAEIKRQARDKAVQVRCHEVAQFYMQLVRVQREGHSSNAKGELLINMNEESGHVQPRMWLKESHGGRWDFRADQISKFEFKDGNRYTEVNFTPMAELEAQAQKEIEAEKVGA